MKKNIFAFLFTTVIVSSLFSSCSESINEQTYRREVVIDGILEAGKSIDTLKISWTGEITKYYDLKEVAITNAIVIVRGVDNSFYDSLVYDPFVPARYYSKDTTKKIAPNKTYELYVKTFTPEVRVVTARTTVPDTFSITNSTLKNGDTTYFIVIAPPHSFSWSPSNNYATYLPTISYLDSNAAMIPKIFYRDTLSKDFQRPDKVGFRVGLPPQQLSTELPWIFLSYFGTIQFDVYAIDFNYSDYFNQSIPAQGGELKEIRYNINGGIGLFGARTAAKNPIRIYLKPL